MLGGIVGIVVFLLLFFYVAFFNKGAAGERSVARRLATLPKEQYVILNDLLLPTSYGTTQIDHVVVSIYGIFVIETKNYKGIIYGGQDAETWTQNVWGNKYSMPNPIRQNKVHVKAIGRYLNTLRIQSNIYSIVAFSSRANVLPNSTECHIIYYNQIKKAIRLYNTPQLTIEQVNQIVSVLQSEHLDTKESRRNHNRQVRDNQRERQLKIDNGICPRCGGTLILRNGKFGRFYGCSNYPNCKFIIK